MWYCIAQKHPLAFNVTCIHYTLNNNTVKRNRYDRLWMHLKLESCNVYIMIVTLLSTFFRLFTIKSKPRKSQQMCAGWLDSPETFSDILRKINICSPSHQAISFGDFSNLKTFSLVSGQQTTVKAGSHCSDNDNDAKRTHFIG